MDYRLFNPHTRFFYYLLEKYNREKAEKESKLTNRSDKEIKTKQPEPPSKDLKE